MSIKLPDISDVAISVIPTRRGNKIKIHAGLHEAKKAVQATYHTQRVPDDTAHFGWRYGPRVTHEAQIYTIVDNGWVLMYDIPENTLTDELPWKKDK